MFLCAKQNVVILEWGQIKFSALNVPVYQLTKDLICFNTLRWKHPDIYLVSFCFELRKWRFVARHFPISKQTFSSDILSLWPLPCAGQMARTDPELLPAADSLSLHRHIWWCDKLLWEVEMDLANCTIVFTRAHEGSRAHQGDGKRRKNRDLKLHILAPMCLAHFLHGGCPWGNDRV